MELIILMICHHVMLQKMGCIRQANSELGAAAVIRQMIVKVVQLMQKTLVTLVKTNGLL